MKKLASCVVVVLLFCPLALSAATSESFSLTLLHTNDVHSRVLEIDESDQFCNEEQMAKTGCFGGVSRRVSLVKKIRENTKNVLLLDAGDQFQGSPFYTKYLGAESYPFMNQMGYAAMALGNHEFDDGPQVLAAYIKNLKFPVISANTDVSRDPHLKGLVKPYAVVSVNGKKIGITGYTTLETATGSNPGEKVHFAPIITSVRSAVESLRKLGVRTIIISSHAGYETDLLVAKSVEGISAIVGGHTNTFLSNTDRTAQGPYPTVVRSPKNRPVLVVSAYAYGKYLGRLDMVFNAAGELVSWQGEPILLDSSIPFDPETSKKVAQLRAPLIERGKKIVGILTKDLSGNYLSCRHDSCGLGSLLAQAMLYATKSEKVQIAMIQAGTIRASLNQGKITHDQIATSMPYSEHLEVIALTGSKIKTILEHSVSRAENHGNDGTGRFLQTAGLKFSWNPKGAVGRRVKDILVFTAGGWEKLQEDHSYSVVMSSFIRKGGDGYHMLPHMAKSFKSIGKRARDVFAEYLATNKVDYVIHGARRAIS